MREVAMGLFDLFKRKEQRELPSDDLMLWVNVAAKTAGTLWTLLHQDPKMLTDPYARVILRSDWGVGIACGKRAPSAILGESDVAFVFLREDSESFSRWAGCVQENSEAFLRIETEQFAKRLTATLRERVNVVN